MKAYFNGQEVIPMLNGKRITFYFGVLNIDNKLITADGLNFSTADGNRFLVREG